VNFSNNEKILTTMIAIIIMISEFISLFGMTLPFRGTHRSIMKANLSWEL